jgi:uncharacterized hydrophobic protein (TIGR00271 family)
MPLLHLRVIAPAARTDQVVATLHAEPGAASIAVVPGAARQPLGDLVLADVARECVPDLLARLEELGVDQSGAISLSAVDTAIGNAAERAERDAPGEGADALIWQQVVSRTGEDSTLTWTFLAFMTLACLLAAIGIATDSPITIVGAMVVGPEFGPLAGIAVGLLLHRRESVRRALVALLIGFPVAVLVTVAVAAIWRATGLVDPQDLVGARQTEFIYHPGWFSLITAIVAGAAGTLSLTSAKSAALIGVFISVTTIPAAGNVAVGLVFGQWGEAAGSLLQLAINLTGIVAAAYLVLLAQSRWKLRRTGAPAGQP